MANKTNKEIHVNVDNDTVKEAVNYVRMVGAGHLNGCVLTGPAGMGKTHLVEHTLQEMGREYVLYGGHITLAEIYEFLYENADALIFFDDVSQVITKTEIMEMLKQALNTSGSRTLHYRSKNVLSENVKNHFDFSGQIICAFNAMDTQNPNVKAIVDRAPSVELRYSRKDVEDIMWKIAEAPGGDLREDEKMIVTEEIISYTDNTMDVSLRKQFLAFSIFASHKQWHGEGNTSWIPQVHNLFGKKKRSKVEQLFIELVGEKGTIPRPDFVKAMAVQFEVSPRTAQRRIGEFLDMGIMSENKKKGGLLRLEK